MDNRYRDIYSELFGYWSADRPLQPRGQGLARPVRPVWDRWSHAVAQEIIQAERDSKAELRPDARVLLLVNFTAMIAVPLDSAEIVTPQQIRQFVRDDVTTLINQAKASRKVEKPAAISGHEIVDALSRSWKRLKVSPSELWDE